MIQGVQFGGLHKKISLTKAGATTLTVPVGRRYVIYLGGGKYTADATEATRSMAVYIDSGAGTVEVWLAALACTAGAEKRMGIGGHSSVGSFIDAWYAVPPCGLMLPAGYRFLVGIGNAQAGDTWELDLFLYDWVVGS